MISAAGGMGAEATRHAEPLPGQAAPVPEEMWRGCSGKWPDSVGKYDLVHTGQRAGARTTAFFFFFATAYIFAVNVLGCYL